MRFERVKGRLGTEPEEAWGKNDERFTRFSLCCDSYEEGKIWYNVLGKGPLVDFINRQFSKGDWATCEGEVTIKPYTDKQGRSRIERVMRLKRIFDMHGVSCEATEEAKKRSSDEVEIAWREKQQEEIKTYPFRWAREGFFDTAGGKIALQTAPEVWAETHDDEDGIVPIEKVKSFLASLSKR